MKVNVNECVWVKLNDYGREILAAAHVERWKQRSTPFEFKLPGEDLDGWSKWQLWKLMQDFGPHMYLGGAMPFDSEIEVRPREGA